MEFSKGLDREDERQANLFEQVLRSGHIVEGGTHEARIAVSLIATREIGRGQRWRHARGTRLEETGTLRSIVFNHLKETEEETG